MTMPLTLHHWQTLLMTLAAGYHVDQNRKAGKISIKLLVKKIAYGRWASERLASRGHLNHLVILNRSRCMKGFKGPQTCPKTSYIRAVAANALEI